MYGMTFVACCLLILRLGYLQIARGDEFRTLAANAREDKIEVLPARGWIYDANGNLLAYDKPSYDLYLAKDSSLRSQYPAIAQKLASILNVKVSDLLTKMQTDTYLSQIPIATGLTDQQLAYVEEHRAELPGINVVAESQREYPFGDLAGQVLGYTGQIPAAELDHYKSLGYLTDQTVGLSGLEKQYENLLQGQVGYQLVQVNSNGTPLQTLDYSPPPVPGDNLQLTLDGHLQAMAQQLVLDAVQHSQYSADIKDAEAVVLDVKTGGVLAMVSYPYMDPNWYTNGSYNQHAHYLATSGAQLNNVIQSPRYPGSTVKMANLITGLEQGVITQDTNLEDHMMTRIGTASLSDDGMVHGWVNPVKAIAVSCDTFFYEVGLWLGKWMGSDAVHGGGYTGASSYQEWLNTQFARGITELFAGEARFGLGVKTGIDLPGEVSGTFYVEDARKQWARVPFNLQAAEQSLQKQGSYTLYGTPADLAFAGIGQSQQFTPIELAQYVAAIANGGKLVQPHLLQKIMPPNGGQVQTVQPVVKDLKINPQFLKMAQQGMFEAVNSPEGTAYGVFNNDPYQAAGKTGTAQIVENGQKLDNSVFVGYAPYNNPEIAICVMLPGAGYGAESAAPLAEKIMNVYFQERHEFFPSDQWQNNQVPANYTQWTAYTLPEQAH
ncbi:MAG: penicillin-binding protein 2 [Alicyclobacillus sp.]|nr:penicillin-binding protein 2 [Alicyclobacillus sp.]